MFPLHMITLADLPPGQRGTVSGISGDERGRLLDLGITEGSEVCCRMRGAGGSPVAFTVRGVTLALRAETCRQIRLQAESAQTWLLAGNPNVGKSTVFNALTGMKQHTGNWCGKTVSGAEGVCSYRGREIRLIDTPGTYSVLSQNAEEAAARDAICNIPHSRVICVCDAVGLARGLILAQQLAEMDPHTVLCVNLMDEAKRRQIRIDLVKLSQMLHIPVAGITARRRSTLGSLLETASADLPAEIPYTPYTEPVEQAIAAVSAHLPDGLPVTKRWAALRLLLGDCPFAADTDISDGTAILHAHGFTPECLREQIAAETARRADAIYAACVKSPAENGLPEQKADRILTGKLLKYPLMLGFLLLTFWITLVGANYPSELLASGCTALCTWLRDLLQTVGMPAFFTGALVDGMLRGTGWVVSVMLPPMAIFFPLFTLLEDIGLLPRIAFNMDTCCAKCRACGKQALTMAMGFGCNAVGVTGCRIIASRRERLIAILTNAFVPCNGRFPAMLAVVTAFFAGTGDSLRAASVMTLLIVLSITVSLAVSALLGRTLLRGEPSSFVLELPPYRRPQIMQILVRSLLDRTVFVVERAVTVAAPVSLLIWLLANWQTAGGNMLQMLGSLLDPAGKLIGLDGVLLLAFILGFPANETVLPVAVTAYLGSSMLTDYGSAAALSGLLTAHGWTAVTAVCFLIFTMFHAPCAATLMTVKRETGSILWTVLAAILPTAAGILLCGLIAAVFRS